MAHKILNKDVCEPEMHVIGEIVGCSGLDDENVFATFEVVKGKEWSCVGGEQKGQTQVDYPSSDGNLAVWNHPLDLHYFTKSMQGWPKIWFEVWRMDLYGGNSIAGYGFGFLPTQPGNHQMEVHNTSSVFACATA